jgi:uncharacterized membrane protein (UPF0182 family)
MRNWKMLPAILGVTAILAVGLYVAFYFVFLDFFVDLWWFRSLEFESYFWLRWLYRFIFSVVVTVFFFAVFMFHFFIASRYLGLNPPDEVVADNKKMRNFQRFADVFMNGSAKIYTPVSLILAILIAIPFYLQWEQALLFFFGGNAGVNDAVYGNDIGFYLFSYPVYILIQKELLLSAAVVFLATGLLYWLENIFVPNQRKQFPLGAKLHLAVLLGFVALFVIWGFLLERFGLLYSNNNEPVFFGPGFVELRYQLPVIWLLIITTFVITGLIIFNVFAEKHRHKTPLILVALAILVELRGIIFATILIQL